jgi:hypothetical protein
LATEAVGNMAAFSINNPNSSHVNFLQYFQELQVFPTKSAPEEIMP